MAYQVIAGRMRAAVSRFFRSRDLPLLNRRCVLVYLVLAVAFAFITLISSLSYAVVTYTPPGVKPASYLTAVRSDPDHPGHFFALSYHDFSNLNEMFPEVRWGFSKRARVMEVAIDESSVSLRTELAVQHVSSEFLELLGIEPVWGRISISSAREPFAVLSERTRKTLFGEDVPEVDKNIVLDGMTLLPVAGVVADEFRGVQFEKADLWVVNPDSHFAASLDHQAGDQYVPNLEVFGRSDESRQSLANMNLLSADYEYITEITTETVVQTPDGPSIVTSERTWGVSESDKLEIYPGFHVYPWMYESAEGGVQVLIGLGLLVVVLVAAMLTEFLRYELIRRPKAIWVRFAVGATPWDFVRENLAVHSGWLIVTFSAVVFLSQPLKAVLFVAGPFASFPGDLALTDHIVGNAVSFLILASVFAFSLGRASFLALRSNPETTPKRAYATTVAVGAHVLLFLCIVSLTIIVSSAFHYLSYRTFDYGFDNLEVSYIWVTTSDIEPERLREALDSHPGVNSSRLGILPCEPLSGLPPPLELSEQWETGGVQIYENRVDGSFFETLGARTLAGSADLSSDENVVLSIAAARMLNEDIAQVVGSVIELPSQSRRARVATIAGVVSDVKYGGYTEPTPPIIYSLSPEFRPSFEFWALHHSGDIQQVLSEVRNRLDLSRSSVDFMTTPKQLAEVDFLAEKGIELLKGFIAIIVFLLSLSAMHWSELKRLEDSQRRLAIETAIGASLANLTVEYSLKACVRIVAVFVVVCGFALLIYLLAPSYIEGLNLWALLLVLVFVLIWNVLTVHTYITRLVTMKPIYALTY